jgi:hypothetical protein
MSRYIVAYENALITGTLDEAVSRAKQFAAHGKVLVVYEIVAARRFQFDVPPPKRTA